MLTDNILFNAQVRYIDIDTACDRGKQRHGAGHPGQGRTWMWIRSSTWSAWVTSSKLHVVVMIVPPLRVVQPGTLRVRERTQSVH